MYKKPGRLTFCTIIIPIVFFLTLISDSCSADKKQRPPNVVIIFLDDSGWSDFQPFSQGSFKTPGIQQLATEGTMFQNFYVPQAICSASRSALITGCYPGRTKVFGAHPPRARGLETTFPTMGEVFKAGGYATAVFGKWHCGDQPGTRPHDRGFDESSGLMYSNDMWKHHPENPEYWGQFPIAFWKNGEVIIEDVSAEDQKKLTKWYTEHAVDFIERHSKEPFLLYVPHSMPHVPIFCSEEFEGKSGVGPYGDVIMELDWSVAEITEALKDNDLDDNTIVIFTSDNGPWISYWNHAGTTPYREAKGTSFDGGIRSACIIKYPGQVEASGISSQAFSTIDLLPTLCHLTGVPLPDSEIDGMNVWDLIVAKPGAENPHDFYAFSNGSNFEAVMSGDGKWKLHLPHNYRSLEVAGVDGIPGKYKQLHTDLSLYDLDDVKEEYPEILEALMEYAETHSSMFYSFKEE